MRHVQCKHLAFALGLFADDLNSSNILSGCEFSDIKQEQTNNDKMPNIAAISEDNVLTYMCEFLVSIMRSLYPLVRRLNTDDHIHKIPRLVTFFAVRDMKYWITTLILFSFHQLTHAEDAQGDWDSALNNFLMLLSAEQLKQVTYSFNDKDRTDWHYFPKDSRPGIAYAQLDEKQRAQFKNFLQHYLSDQGIQKVHLIMALEQTLRELEGRDIVSDSYRDPEKFNFMLFKKNDDIYTWRFEGHHLSLNFTIVNKQISVTPSFYGANPAEYLVGNKSIIALENEKKLAVNLMETLTQAQRERTIFSNTPPYDIITGVKEKTSLKNKVGIAYSALSKLQQNTLRALIDTYVSNLEENIKHTKWNEIEENLNSIYFGWAGDPTGEQGHYYRIHGDSFVIEYDNARSNANHIHTVWRDFNNDFGADLLHQHYQLSEHQK